MVHAEIVLQGDGREGLRGGFHLHIFLRLNGLVQTVAPATAFHDTSRTLVDNLDLAVDDHIVHVLGEHGVGLEQLVDRVHALGLEGVVGIEFVLEALFLFRAALPFLDAGHLVAQARHQEEVLVAHRLGEDLVALVGEFHAALLLVDDEVKFIGHHALLDVLVLEGGADDLALGFLQDLLDAGLAEVLDQRLVLRESLVGTQQQDLALVLDLAGCDQALGLVEGLVDEVLLCVIEALHIRLVLNKSLVTRTLHRAGNDERGTGIVDQHGVHLVDDGEVVLALHQVLRVDGHVVAQVVEAELVVRAEGDVGLVRVAARVGAGLVLVDAVDAQAVEHIERAHPLGVSFREVVVDGDHMDAFARQGIEEHRKRRHEGLAFTGGHLGDLALMQDDAADQLHVVMDHVPGDHVAAGHPAVAPDGIVAVDVHEVVVGAQVAVEFGGLHADAFVLLEAARRRFHDGERLRKHLVEYFFNFLVDGLHQLVEFRGQLLFPRDFHLRIGELLADLRHFLFLRRRVGANLVAQGGTLGAQIVVAELVEAVVGRQYQFQGGIDLLDVAFRLGTEQFLQ